MTVHSQLLSEAILSSRVLIARYFPGFNDANHTRQPTHLPNHFAWQMGHLALVMFRIAEKFDGTGLPDHAFVSGDRGDGKRFGSESVSFKSVPTDDPARYPNCVRCIEIFNLSCEHLARLALESDDAKLATMIPWGPISISLSAAAQRMVFHNGTHCGQIIDLRRALALGRVLE